jgi:hypothetical protein
VADTEGDEDMDKAAICKALGIAEDSTQEQITAAIAAQGAKLGNETEAKTALTAELQAQKERVVELERAAEEKRKEEAKDLVEAYIKAGRIAPASRERAQTLALSDRESFYAVYGKEEEPGQAVAPVGTVSEPDQATQPGSSGTGLSETEIAACTKMGISPERFEQEKQRRESKGLLNSRADLPDSRDRFIPVQ